MGQRTFNSPFVKLFSANQGSLGSITDLAPTLTAPTPGNGGVFDLYTLNEVYTGARLMFFGAGSATQTFTARIWAWYPVDLGGGVTEWVPVHLMDVLVTLGTTAGSVGGLGAANLFGTTIAVTGTATLESTAYAIESPGSNRPAVVKLDPAGARYLQVQFGTTATATSANGLAAGF